MKRTINILFCGSFKFLDEMKEIAKELKPLGFVCFLPKFFLGDFPSSKIESLKNERKKRGFSAGDLKKVVGVTKWFYDCFPRADILVIYDKDGYVGLSLAAEIGVAHIIKKPTYFIEKPTDAGLWTLLKFSDNFKVVSSKKLVKELSKFNHAKKM